MASVNDNIANAIFVDDTTFPNAITDTAGRAARKNNPISSVGNTKETNEPGNAGSTMWFKFKPRPEDVGVNLYFGCGGFDTYLGVYESTTGTATDFSGLTMIFQNDDNGATYYSGANSGGAVTLARKWYYIQAGGFSTNQGDITTYTPLPNNDSAEYPPLNVLAENLAGEVVNPALDRTPSLVSLPGEVVNVALNRGIKTFELTPSGSNTTRLTGQLWPRGEGYVKEVS